MADLALAAVTPQITFSTSTVTLLQITAPTNQRLKVKEASVSFQGTSNTAAPIEVDVLRQTTAGTMTSLTPKLVDKDMQETIQSTAQHTATVEPTAGDILMSEAVHPQTGYTWQAPFGGEIKVQGGGRLGTRLVTPGAGGTAFARYIYEE